MAVGLDDLAHGVHAGFEGLQNAVPESSSAFVRRLGALKLLGRQGVDFVHVLGRTISIGSG